MIPAPGPGPLSRIRNNRCSPSSSELSFFAPYVKNVCATSLSLGFLGSLGKPLHLPFSFFSIGTAWPCAVHSSRNKKACLSPFAHFFSLSLRFFLRFCLSPESSRLLVLCPDHAQLSPPFFPLRNCDASTFVLAIVGALSCAFGVSPVTL